MNETIKTYGIYSLIVLYTLINLYYKKFMNIVIFVGIFVISLNIFNNIEKSIIIAYILSIVWGIIRNFHLLENFEQNSNKKLNKSLNKNIDTTEYNIKHDKDIQRLNTIENKKPPKPKESYKNNKLYTLSNNDNNIQDINHDIKNLISEGLVIKYMEKLRKENINMVYQKRVNIMHLKPILPELASGKIKLMKNSIDNNNNEFMNKPIIISNDNYILDGHHRWYVRKMYSNSNNKKYSNRIINVKIIDMDIKTLINNIREYKSTYNKQLITNYKVDLNTLNGVKNSLDNIKKNISNIEKFYKEVNNLKIV